MSARGMRGPLHVLLSEGSSLTAREFVTVLGRHGVIVDVVSSSRMPLAGFSRWCRKVHAAPVPAADPVGYLRAVRSLMETGRYDALLPTHEQAWLFSVGRGLLGDCAVPVASADSFDKVQSKLAFARTLDGLGLPQPDWLEIGGEDDLDRLGYPVWVKAAFSTAGQGVVKVHDHVEALNAWRRQMHPGCSVMVQRPAEGRYAQVQGVFDHGMLLGAAASQALATGVGGSAAARESVRHPIAVQALETLGRSLKWTGGICLDYFHVDGRPRFIECNPRITEPGNADAAGVNLPGLLIQAAAHQLAEHPVPMIARPGVRTRSTMAMLMGTASMNQSRAAIIRTLFAPLSEHSPLHDSREVLTPGIHDPQSLIQAAAVTGALIMNPGLVGKLAGSTIDSYSIPETSIRTVRGHRGEG